MKKIVLVNTYSQRGGAAIAAERLLHALSLQHVKVDMLVLKSGVTTSYVHPVASRIRRLWNFLWERLIIFLKNGFSRKKLFQVSIANTGVDISTHPLVKEADIIHLHWINHGFLSLKDIGKLLQLNKPVFWTMHDLWPATAICYYPDTCDFYQTQCHECPFTGRKKYPDLAKMVFEKKEKIDWQKIYFIGCSNWIVQKAGKSALLRNSFFTSIPNPIDISFFAPKNREEARCALKLPQDKKLLLFVADIIRDERKGLQYLIKACQLLKVSRPGIEKKFEIVLMGKESPELLAAFVPFNIHSLGYVSTPEKLVKAYSSVDVFVIPSLEDNLPNTVMEAMACGIPCCGFNTGGIPEMIDDRVNGYVANTTTSEELASGIDWILSYPAPESLKRAAREKVVNTYNEQRIAQLHIDLYKQSIV